MTIGTLMAAGGWSRRTRHLVNTAFALATPLGVMLFGLGLSSASTNTTWLLGGALAFSAGMFICISSSDLLPELQFHSHDRVKLSLALVLGLAMAWGIGLFEGHDHGHADHGHEHGQNHAAPHDHDGDEHHHHAAGEH